MEEPGYNLCDGWISVAGLCFLESLLMKITLSPLFITRFCGEKPAELISIALLLFSSGVLMGALLAVWRVQP